MKKLVVLVAIIMMIVPLFALAATPCTLDAVKSSPQDKLGQLPRCVNQIYIWSLGVGSLLALLMMVAGGYAYMTSSGNAEQASKGVEMIWGAVIGLALLFGAYLLLNTINPDLVNFKVSSCLEDSTAPGCTGTNTNNNTNQEAPRE